MGATDLKSLFEACAVGDHSKLFTFMSSTHCSSLSTLRDENDQSLLNIACKHGKLNVAEALITIFDCHLTVDDVSAVCRGSHFIMASLFAQNGQWLASAEFRNNTMLHFACRVGHLPIVRCIVQRESNTICVPDDTSHCPLPFQSVLVTRVNNDNELPVMTACRYGHIDVIKFFLEEVMYSKFVLSANQILMVLLQLASRYNHQGIAKYLIEVHKADWTLEMQLSLQKLAGFKNDRIKATVTMKVFNTALIQASLYGNIDLVKVMMKYKKPDDLSAHSDYTPLHFASISDSLKVAKFLVEECGYDINVLSKYKNTPLQIACKWGSLHVATYFVENDCDINIANYASETALCIAVRNGHEKICQMLLSNANCRVDIFGTESPLHCACYANLSSSSMIQLLLQKEGCNLDLADENGITPLYIACYLENAEAVTLLTERCNIVDANRFKESPVHILCRLKRLDVLKIILRNFNGELNMQNVYGETPLHIACYKDAIDIVAFLLEQKYCDANIKNKDGSTAMHIAVSRLNLECVQLLKPYSDVFAQDCKGNTPIHLACQNRIGFEVAKCLLEDVKDVHATNEAGDTAIHVACKSGCLDIVKYLVDKQHCDPSVPNVCNGNTPLHTACEVCNFTIAEYLIVSCRCNPCSTNLDTNTPLCHALQASQLLSNFGDSESCKLIKLLVLNKLVDPCKQFSGGVPFINFILIKNVVELVIWLIEEKFCQPIEKDSDGNTLLHAVCKTYNRGYRSYTHQNREGQNVDPLIKTLFSSEFEDLYIDNCVNEQGDTPLHCACSNGNSSCVEAILESEKLSKKFISHKDHSGKTPIELTDDYECISLLIGYGVNPEDFFHRYEHILKQHESNYPLKTNVRVIVLGNSGAGKTTLKQALLYTGKSDVTDVGGPTSGIVTSRHCAPGYNIDFHDFAGQPEFESSNSEFLRNVLSYSDSPSLPIFILVFDASSPKVVRNIQYWFSFLKNYAVSDIKFRVILVGSHMDLIPSLPDQITNSLKTLQQSQSQVIKCCDPVFLDCRKVGSVEIFDLRAIITQSCSSLVQSIKHDCRCHVLFAFLHSFWEPAIMLQKLQSRIRKSRNYDHPLPYTRDKLLDLLKTLHAGGHILLLKGSANDDSDFFVIVHQERLFNTVCGKLFAPTDNPKFESQLKFDNNTGVVPASKVTELFPDLDPMMLKEFLVHSEFCMPIEDSETLKLIDSASDEHKLNCQQPSVEAQEYSSLTTSAVSAVPVSGHYFFPGFVSREKPPNTYVDNSAAYSNYQCGWLLQCKPNQFLSPRFLQVLLLRFVFNFATASPDSFLKRRCSIWKNGVNWSTQSGVEVFLEVVEQNTAVVVLMRCHRNCEIQCISLRSDIIKRVHDIKKQFCQSVTVDEYVIHPSSLRLVAHEMATNIDSCRKVSFSDISDSVTGNSHFAFDNTDKSISLSDLLYFDGLCSIKKKEITDLFDIDLAEREVPNSFFLSIASSLVNHYDQVVEMVKHALPMVSPIEISNLEEELDLSNKTKRIVNIFENVWKIRSAKATYSEMRELLENYSIFRGRNPLLSVH